MKGEFEEGMCISSSYPTLVFGVSSMLSIRWLSCNGTCLNVLLSNNPVYGEMRIRLQHPCRGFLSSSQLSFRLVVGKSKSADQVKSKKG